MTPAELGDVMLCYVMCSYSQVIAWGQQSGKLRDAVVNLVTSSFLDYSTQHTL